ncbi:DUF2235 domain-containing protein [Pectobacterium brasiliense]|uniref:DUF2235 domain-containing protein n=1 Tax=Pectobacterium brasiliense TaxID=180957 RepID=A0A3S0Y4X6_9GAMM|nr:MULTISPECIES: DUF2235 domain-containing protein [Pectobacterium]GKW30343.1 hypothetical protein PEC331060_35210 [Pectobacterium carotovorum subsp. carotovorum]MBN3048702.1 DUF2235 domain-containing protein [Pectobacterium brasiliense]MBN3074690.1 DUF2235 domain-containing protein [Pectobacterium brasiliense]MBN3086139.1 DUF2235 domain-containing protein [Pectobacterium brasiliense]MBN3089713.1 DUF2235 domain-containing protein [Pectobacterium brasiliense]
MVDWDDLECRVAREESRYQAGIGTCSLVLQIGFFFDGLKRNINVDEESQRLTNVGRLFRAHSLKIKADLISSYTYAKVYIPGLATPLDDTPSERLDSILDARQKALPEDYADALVEQGKETAVDTVKGVFKGDWSQVLSNKLDDLRTMKSGLDAVASTAKKAVTRALLEAAEPIRDNPIVAELMMTGVDARVDLAKNKFKESIALSKKENQLPIKLIQISVFGADLGAALARRFIDELLVSVCTKVGSEYRYEDSKVEVIFAGLFDCTRRSSLDMGDTVATVSDGTGLVARHPVVGMITTAFGAKVIAFDKPLHPAVKSALHLIAAHERREYRPLLPLGPLRSGWREVLCPGISEDVTGGLLPNEQRPSAELCRVPLRQMFETARRAQVPFPNFRTLDAKNPRVAQYFVMQDSRQGYSAKAYSEFYSEWVGKTAPTPEVFELHMIHYCVWLGEKLHDYKILLRNVSGSERDKLNAQWGWLKQVEYDADNVRRSRGLRRQMYHGAALVKFFDESKRVPREADIFFNYFMHDFTSEELKFATLNEQANTMLRNNNFFVPRGIEVLAADDEAAA